jgi:hypothetical protein
MAAQTCLAVEMVIAHRIGGELAAVQFAAVRIVGNFALLAVVRLITGRIALRSTAASKQIARSLFGVGRNATFDSAYPGICLTDGCGYTTDGII